MKPILTGLSGLFLLTCGMALAQPPQQGVARDQAGAVPAREPLPQINVIELIDGLADEMDKEFVLDPRMSVMLPGTLSSDDADYETLLAVLRQNGFATVETANQILIVPEADMRIAPSRILQQDDRRVSDHEIVTRVINLPVANQAGDGTDIGIAPQLVPLLRPMMGQSAQLGTVGGGTKLVIVDRYDNVRRITAVVEALTR